MADPDLPEDWRDALETADIEPTPGEPPEDAPAGWSWVESHSSYGERGYLRALLGAETDEVRLHVEGALPSSDCDRSELRRAVFENLTAALETDWRRETLDHGWRLTAKVDADGPPDSFPDLLDRLDDLAEHVSADTTDPLPPSWPPPTGPRPEGETSTIESPDESNSGSDGTGDETPSGGDRAPDDDALESIGRSGDTDPMETDARESFEDITFDNVDIESAGEDRALASIRLERRLSPRAAEQLARQLCHSIRSRRELSVRPLPADDERSDEVDATPLRIEARRASLGERPAADDRPAVEQLRTFFDRLERFQQHGFAPAEVLGIGEPPPQTEQTGSTGGPSRTPASESQTDAGGPADGPAPGGATNDREREPETSTPDLSVDGPAPADSPPAPFDRSSGAPPDDSGSGPATRSDASDEVVLDLNGGGEPSEPVTEAGLSPGHYTDPRLLREDATTSLVDVVLRHPGYADDRMAHNLSILLDIEFHDAKEIVETAPRIIAWGVSRRRGLQFERVIEDAGGKVVLVEPDSLTESAGGE
ncbi:MAG: hypothetical protein ABEL76_15885 [Bradymonadaceae bacterium]